MPASLTQPQIHAFSDDALGNDDATTLAQRIRNGEVTVSEVTRAAIERAGKVTPVINGIVTEAWDSAQQQADQLSVAGPDAGAGFFSGVPTFIKDNTDIAGLPTLHGSKAVPPNIASRTSPFASQLLAQGFLCLGKSTLPEFGFNATTEPAHLKPTCNPWNPAFSTGASSGGSAALVAAGVVPIAHANDGGGSIRIPAACCGLVGLKPSRGRLVDNDAASSFAHQYCYRWNRKPLCARHSTLYGTGRTSLPPAGVAGYRLREWANGEKTEDWPGARLHYRPQHG
jgi:amidase